MIIVKVIGGLGNQMFQYAFYKSLCKIYPDTKLDILSFEDYRLHNGYELEKIFINLNSVYANANEIRKLADNHHGSTAHIRKKFFGIKKTHYLEKFLGYNNVCLDKLKNRYFEGYWQSEKYFSHIEGVIRQEFRFTPFDEKMNINISKEINLTNSISVHVRRGDYVNHPLYSNICTELYYEKAINLMLKRVDHPHFFVFSDDISWCIDNLKLTDRVTYINWNNKEKSYRDMQLMSLCKHNIIANSSFSWWGAWLNTNTDKIVIAPSRVINSNHDIVDFVPDQWLKI